MKFIFADSLDYVDPGYDFENDRHASGRKPYWDDQYPHEILRYAPYDGVLVSRAVVGDHRFTGKYSESQSMRFRRVGARKFLRLEGPGLDDKLLFGDCGAFSYVKYAEPPYTPEDMIAFYEDGGFTHGFSIDHIIFDFKPDAKSYWDGIDASNPEQDDNYRRQRITLEMAEAFIEGCRQAKVGFEPVGVIQGWSPVSMAHAARKLASMGYHYLALGGMVPLQTPAIHTAVRAVHKALDGMRNIQLHILGFAKADALSEFIDYPLLSSIDTTSPLLRAFKDARTNYYLPLKDSKTIDYFAAIRIPQALENERLKRAVKKGLYRQEDLVTKEQTALTAIRAFDKGQASLEETLDVIMAYSRPLICTDYNPSQADENQLAQLLQFGIGSTAIPV